MKIVGLIVAESEARFDAIAEKLSAAASRRYSCPLAFRRVSGTLGLFFTEKAVREDLAPGAVAYSGHITAPASQLAAQVMGQFGTGEDAPVRISESLGGTHCIVAARANEALAWCSRPGCSPAYYVEQDGVTVVSSRPGLLKEVFALKPDPEYWKWVAGVGYPVDDTSPYAGCKAILAGTALRISGHGARLVGYELPPHGKVPATKAEADAAEEIARQELLRACSIVEQYPDAIFRLSGGKDSRLVASALHALGLHCHVRTSGAGEGELARQVAEIGKFSFSLEAPIHELNVQSPLDAALRALSETDGFIHLQAHKSLNTRPFIDSAPSGLIMGQIELTKGGYAKGKVNIGRPKAREALANYVLTDIPRHRRDLDAWMESYLDTKSYADPLDLLYFPYSQTRASRYLEVSYLMMARHTTPIFPPNDERMFLAISNVDRKRRASERVMHDMIAANSPHMARLPIYGDKWKFSSDPAHIPCAPEKAKPVSDRNPFHIKASLDLMRDHIRQNPVVWSLIEDSVSDAALVQCGLRNGAVPPGSELNRNGKLKLLMRLFLISVAADRWSAV